MKRILLTIMGISLLLVAPATVFAHPAVTLYDANGQRIIDQLSNSDTVTAANGTVYKQGPAYSPKQTCGKCHDYDSITKAYHFREGSTPDVSQRNNEGNAPLGVSDTWVSEIRETTELQKYLTNAYGHLLSPGQYGAW